MGGSPPTPKEEQTVVEEREELNTVYQVSLAITSISYHKSLLFYCTVAIYPYFCK